MSKMSEKHSGSMYAGCEMRINAVNYRVIKIQYILESGIDVLKV